MAEIVECVSCGSDSETIVTKLKCGKCKKEYFFDKKNKTYLLKEIKCKKCSKLSKTISSKHVCDKCGAEYVFDSVGSWIFKEKGIYLKGGLHSFNKFQTSGFPSELWIGIVALVLAILLFSEQDTFFFGLIPFLVLIFCAFKLFKRFQKTGSSFSRFVGVPEEKLSKEGEKIKKKVESKKTNETAGKATALLASGIGGLAIIAVIFIVMMGIIWVVIEGINQCEFLDGFGRCVKVGNMKFIPPEGWEVKTDLADSWDVVQVVGPEKDGSQPNFIIQRYNDVPGTIDELAIEAEAELKSYGVEVLSMVHHGADIGGHETRQLVFKMYVPEKGYYAKGEQVYFKRGGDLYVITFSTKESQYYNYEWDFDGSRNTIIFVED